MLFALTSEESQMLVNMLAARDPHGHVVVMPNRTLDALAARGLIEIGKFISGGIWSGENPIIHDDPLLYIIRFTADGKIAARNHVLTARAKDVEDYAKSLDKSIDQGGNG